MESGFRNERSPKLIELLELLKGYTGTDRIMFGQQNAGHIGVTIANNDGTESDCRNLCGKHPAVIGVDTLSFLGYEGKMNDLIKIVKNLHKQGCIVTLSSHMPNFTLGGDEFYDFSPNNTDGDCAKRIMKGGDLNAKYLRFLDMIADFADKCVDLEGDPIPMIFRPFHEDNGDWFWWGRKHLADDKYVTLFRYTVDYLQEQKGIRSFAYSYSPNGHFANERDFLRRYPGDDYIDVLGMDIYRDKPSKDDKFFEKLKTSMEVLWKLSLEHGKPYALTEIGIRVLDSCGGHYEGLAPAGNKVTDFFTELLSFVSSFEAGARCSYFLTWANFSDQQFWAPYEIKNESGEVTFRHEMCDDFVKFCKDSRILLAP